uniref:Glutamine amidotransferase type-1 domain-containing protein n=1 Tax=Macrostomum lignano TaxID=282301 RepID=A0A1I8GHH4_9PLAT
GAGGNANVLKEICEPLGADIYADKFQLGDPTLSALELWGAEYQESDACLVPPDLMERLRRIGARERCPAIDVGVVRDTGVVTLYSFGRGDSVQPPPPLECSQSYLLASLLSVLSCPDVGSKRFLTNKVDRSVTGLVAQQQCVGPLHTPLADVAVVALSYFDRVGGATAIGEQPIKGLLDPSRRRSYGRLRSLTNLAMARVTSLADVNAAPMGGQLVATALATVDFMKQLGVAIDGGKDSLSMAASVTNQTTGETQVIRSPGQLVVSVYAVCPDITLTLQPVLQPHAGPLIHVPLGDLPDACRLGGSAFARCSSGGGDIFGRDCPNPDARPTSGRIRRCPIVVLLTAGHDISDGGLAVAAIEMALAAGGRCGLELRVPDSVACPTAWLMSEEPGWLLQAASNEAANQVLDRLNSAGLSTGVRIVGLATVAGELRIVAGDRVLLDKVSLADLREAWERPSHQLELAQCQPDCARSELRYLREAGGANQYVATATEPCLLPSVDRLLAMERRFTVAIIREEGSNGDREMAAAFYAAGFRVLDVTTGDLAADGDGEDGVSLADCRGVAFVGGFSYADVLGSAKGWAAQVQFHPSVRRELDALRRRGNSFSLGVCNGCQLMARIGWLDGDSDSGSSDSSAPVTLEPNLSGRFESRYPTVRVLPTSCPLLRGMSDSRLGVWSAHGEGRFSVASADSLLAAGRVPLVYVDQAGEATESYPCNPNGSPKGLAAVCSPCGRHLAMMPHPERSFLTWQCPAGQQASTNSSDDNNLASPWFKMFVNAYEFCCETE